MYTREVFRFPPGVNPFKTLPGPPKAGRLPSICLTPSAEEYFIDKQQGLGDVFEVINSKIGIGDLSKPRAILKAWDTEKKYRIYSDKSTDQFVVELFSKKLGEKNLLQTATRQERELLLDPLQADLERKGEKPAIIKSYKEDALRSFREKRQEKMSKQITRDVDDYVSIAVKLAFEKPKLDSIPVVQEILEVGRGSYAQRIADLKKIEERKSLSSSAEKGRSRKVKMDAGKIPKNRGKDCA